MEALGPDTHNFEMGPPAIDQFDIFQAWDGISEEEGENQIDAAVRYAVHMAEEGAKDPENGSFWSNRLKQLYEDKQQQAGLEEFLSFTQTIGQMVACMCENEKMAGFLNNDPWLKDNLLGHSKDDGHGHGGDTHSFEIGDLNHKKDKDKKKKRKATK